MNKHRMWSEIGKMYEELETVVESITLHYCIDDVLVYMNVDAGEETCYEYKGDSFYNVVKQAYFDIILGVEETETEELQLSEETLEGLYRCADDEGIPVDELVNRILDEYTDECEEDDECDGCDGCGYEPEETTSIEDKRQEILDEISDMEKEFTKKYTVAELEFFRDSFKEHFMQ